MRTLANIIAGTKKAEEDRANSDEGNKAETRNPDWQADGARQGKNPDAEKQDDPAVKSLSQISADLQSAAAGAGGSALTLATPPTFSAAMAKAKVTGPTDDEIEAMHPRDAQEALMERQRAIHRARLGIGDDDHPRQGGARHRRRVAT